MTNLIPSEGEIHVIRATHSDTDSHEERHLVWPELGHKLWQFVVLPCVCQPLQALHACVLALCCRLGHAASYKYCV